MFIAILAAGKNGEIGKRGDMPWGRKLKKDLEFVKKTTINKSIIMGSKTFNSLPKVLPGRKHYVVTSNVLSLDSKYSKDNPNIIIVSNLATFIKENENIAEEFYIFGGASLYKQMIKYCKKIYLTLLDQNFDDCDTFFKFDDSDFKKSIIATDNENGLSYTRYLYERK